MGEITPNQFEQELIPTPEKVIEILAQMAEGEFRVTRTYEDEHGKLYRLDAIVSGAIEGESLEFYYIRKGVHPNGDQSSETEIHSIHTKDGSYVSAGPQADLIDGKWKIIE